MKPVQGERSEPRFYYLIRFYYIIVFLKFGSHTRISLRELSAYEAGAFTLKLCDHI